MQGKLRGMLSFTDSNIGIFFGYLILYFFISTICVNFSMYTGFHEGLPQLFDYASILKCYCMTYESRVLFV